MVAAQHALSRVHPVGRRHRSVDPSWTRPAASRHGRSRGRAAPRLSTLVFGLTVGFVFFRVLVSSGCWVPCAYASSSVRRVSVRSATSAARRGSARVLLVLLTSHAFHAKNARCRATRHNVA